MYKYIARYSKENVVKLNFDGEARKLLYMGGASLCVGIIAMGVAVISQGAIQHTFSIFFLVFLVSLWMAYLCIRGYFKVNEIKLAQASLLDNIATIENRLFRDNNMSFEESLIGVSKNGDLFILAHYDGDFKTVLINPDYIHYTDVNMSNKALREFNKSLKNNELNFKYQMII